MSTMLLHPFTPPNEDSLESPESNNGAALTVDAETQSEDQNGSQIGYHQHYDSPPTSNTVSSESYSDGGSSIDERSEGPDDEDRDMSDGGAALTMTLSHADDLNTDMNMVDADIIGAENLVEQFIGAHPDDLYGGLFDYPHAFHELNAGLESIQGTHTSFVQVDVPMTDGQAPATLSVDEPTVEPAQIAPSQTTIQLSEGVAHQLQHFQEEQAHMNQPMEEEANPGFVNNSNEPFLSSSPVHPPSDSFGDISGLWATDDVSATNTTLAANPQNVSHLWGPGAWLEDDPLVEVIIDFPASEASFGYLTHANNIWNAGANTNVGEVEDQFNLSLGDFLHSWATSPALYGYSNPPSYRSLRTRPKAPSLAEVEKQREADKLKPVKRSDLQGERCDVQRIDWKALGVSRLEARQSRRLSYRNYQNLHPGYFDSPRRRGTQLPSTQDYFRFRRMDFEHNIHLSHFQLRNLMSCASRDHVFYADRSRIIHWNPTSGTQGPKKVVMNLTDPSVQPLHAITGGIQISTLTAKHDILVAGGFQGEYALINLKAHKDTKHTEGIVTNDQNSITNHVEVNLSRTSGSPQITFASNDNGVRVLDVETNKFIINHGYEHAINCTALSPDRRLRVLVGDTCQVMISNAETGEILQSLEGHHDFGFACDWADDGWTVATGNQDKLIKIWDARKWTTTSGLACPVATIAAEMAGTRTLKFSPLGSGKRILAAAEPADIVNLIDAETFASKQTLDFFGEIGGIDFTNGGRDLFIANCDPMRGGLMEYERCNMANASLFEDPQTGIEDWRVGSGADWMPADQETSDHSRSWGTTETRKRKAAMMGSHFIDY